VKGLLVVITASCSCPGRCTCCWPRTSGPQGLPDRGHRLLRVPDDALGRVAVRHPRDHAAHRPKGTQPTFKFFTLDDPRPAPTTACGTSRARPATAGRRPRGRGRGGQRPGEAQGRPGHGPQRAVQDPDHRDQQEGQELQRRAGRDQPGRQDLLHDPGRHRGGRDRHLAQDPAGGLRLKRPDFAPKTSFAYRDPGNPYLPSILFLAGSSVLFVVHMLLLGVAERRRPLGVAQRPAPEAEPQPAGAGARR
jgi:hypothetical protein